MLDYILEIRKQSKRKEKLEKEILLLGKCTSKKRALENLNHLLCLQAEFAEKSKNTKNRIRDLELGIQQVDGKIITASQNFYGFGVSNTQRSTIDEKLNSLNEVKSNMYEQLMCNMEEVRRLSLDIVRVREKASRAKDRYEGVCLEVEERVEKMKIRIREMEKHIRKCKGELPEEVLQSEALEPVLSGKIKIFKASEGKCGNCMEKTFARSRQQLEGGAIVICEKCGCAIYFCNEREYMGKLEEETV